MSKLEDRTERLFSYGTLQATPVQIQTFGRQLVGNSDAMDGWAQTFLEITDPYVLRTSGETHHPIVAKTGNPSEFVLGTMFHITPAELESADAYEVDDYERVSVTLRSGTKAWVYVAAKP